MIGIYKITNKLNNKVYIGQSIHIEKRFRQHKSSYKRMDNYLYRAMLKYGIENFNFEIIEECCKEKLNEREQYWIKEYKSNDYEFGYNMTIGGDTASDYFKKPVYQIDITTREIIRKFNSITEASEFVGINHHIISEVCLGQNHTASGYLWRYVDTYDENEVKSHSIIKSGPIGKQVAQIDMNTKEIINVFKTIQEACKNTGIHYADIGKVCNGYRKQSGGYCWKYIS